MSELLDIRIGDRALEHLRSRGLAPTDVSCIPAAAGGPKGLALLPLDRLLASEWLPATSGLELVGASIGAWRMAALAQSEPLAALDRLQHAYVREQNYRERPTPAQVADTCRGLARSVVGEGKAEWRRDLALSVITTRARGGLAGQRSKTAFGLAALANTLSRRRLAAHMERVVFHSGPPSRLPPAFDAFGLTQAPFTERNREDALLASGSIPLICDPVQDIADAPAGEYWDGGLIDYHLLLPYDRYDGLVLYPHFVPHVTPGWLDKYVPWRVRAQRHRWLANVILIAPSPSLLERLPAGKLPDRSDFYRYGSDHAGRIRDWERAIAECERFAEAAMRWLQEPNLAIVQSL